MIFESNGTFLGRTEYASPQNKIHLLPNGKVLLAGNGLRRLNSNYTTDTSFTAAENVLINDLDVQSDGKVVVVGNFSAFNGNSSQVNIARVTADGLADQTFAQNTFGDLYGVKFNPTGKLSFRER